MDHVSYMATFVCATLCKQCILTWDISMFKSHIPGFFFVVCHEAFVNEHWMDAMYEGDVFYLF